MTLPNWTRRARKVALAASQRSRGWGHSAFRFARAKLGLLALLLLAAAVALGVWSLINFWDWLQTGPDGPKSGSTTVRNLGLVIGGVAAILLAVWRSRVAERQAGAAQSQSDTAQQSLLHERYQRGAEMLGSKVLTVRLGGIYALQRLAAEHPEQYHVQITQLFCAFAQHPTKDERIKPKPDAKEGTSAIRAAPRCTSHRDGDQRP